MCSLTENKFWGVHIQVDNTTPKIRVTAPSGHRGQQWIDGAAPAGGKVVTVSVGLRHGIWSQNIVHAWQGATVRIRYVYTLFFPDNVRTVRVYVILPYVAIRLPHYMIMMKM